MIAEPAVAPVTTPVVDTTVAIEVLLQLHVPLPASLNVVDKPAQTVVFPIIAFGKGLTVTVLVVIQPVPSIYVMVVVPGDTLVTTPEPEGTMVATEVLLLLQVPPAVASLNVVIKPMQTLAKPVITDGKGFTNTEVVAMQPVGNV